MKEGNFLKDFPWKLPVKFGFIWPSCFREEDENIQSLHTCHMVLKGMKHQKGKENIHFNIRRYVFNTEQIPTVGISNVTSEGEQNDDTLIQAS